MDKLDCKHNSKEVQKQVSNLVFMPSQPGQLYLRARRLEPLLIPISPVWQLTAQRELKCLARAVLL